jgi:tRNA(fMet)-specific endonuclease VapC
MKYLLDTNVYIRYINGRSPSVLNRMRVTPRSEIAVSTITKAELYFGSAKSQQSQKSLSAQQEFLQTVETVVFDDAAAHAYGRIRAFLERIGTPIGGNDLLIASTAISHNLVLTTHNVQEFQRVPDLLVEDWEL